MNFLVKIIPHLGVSLHQSSSVSSLELETNSLLLGRDDVRPGAGISLGRLFSSDGILARINLILSDRSQLSLLLIQLLVDHLGPAWSNLNTEDSKNLFEKFESSQFVTVSCYQNNFPHNLVRQG